MPALPIMLACGPYDRTRALADGRVAVGGADLRYITLDPEEIFFRMVTYGECGTVPAGWRHRAATRRSP